MTPSAAQYRGDPLGDEIWIADAVDLPQNALRAVERDDRRGLGVVLLDPGLDRLDRVVLAMDQARRDVRRRWVVLQVIDRTGLRVAAAADRALLEQRVRDLDQHHRVEL